MIETWHVREVVRGLFGSALADSPGFAEGLASVLRSYSSYKEDFYSLAARVEDHLFNALYERLGPGMCVRLPSGSEAHRQCHTPHTEPEKPQSSVYHPAF